MILIPSICGLCNGAKSCITAAYKIKSLNNNKVVIYKEILHNKKVVERLKEDGIDSIDSLDDISNEIVIIRGHGEPKSTFEYLEQNNINYYDATCNNVKRIQLLIDDYYNKGYQIIIVGKKGHPEVNGLYGWSNNSALVISSLKEAKEITRDISGNLLVVSQTTFNYYSLLEIVDYLKKINSNLLFINTICNAQKSIQESSKKTASMCDAMFIIGGKNSSNTFELWNICNEICPSFLFESSDEIEIWLKSNNISNWKNIGITGGASTPIEEIKKAKTVIKEKR